VRWTSEPGARLLVVWTERGGPPVARPTRRGFGSRIIELALASELDGQVELDYRPGGLVCTLRAPLAALDKVDAFMALQT
jgi:two-component sensor histidine kinase